MEHLDAIVVSPILDGREANVNVAKALCGHLIIHNMYGGCYIFVYGCSYIGRKAQFGEHRTELEGYFCVGSSCNKFSLVGAQCVDGLGF